MGNVNITWNHQIQFAFLMLVAVFITVTTTANAQYQYDFAITNERGDTLFFDWPPTVSSDSPDEIIIKFRPGVLDYSKLCYEGTPDDDLKPHLMEELFEIDSLISSLDLRKALHDVNGTYLRRLTAANPCADTISISRLGNSISMEHYDFMILELENLEELELETWEIAYLLTLYNQNWIELAEPNRLLSFSNWDPNDYEYNNPGGVPGSQYNLESIGMSTAWDFTTGNYDVKIGIVDSGIDYDNSDLGGSIGAGNKVSGGWSYTFNNRDDIRDSCWHGTIVSGFAGALSNNEIGIAGVAGGDGSEIGSQLQGFQILNASRLSVGVSEIEVANAIAAILEATACNPNSGYGYCCNVINTSWGGFQKDPLLEYAVLEAFLNDVPMVCARGNTVDSLGYASRDSTLVAYPACYNPSWVVNIGGARISKDKHPNSQHGSYVDIIAPFGDYVQGYYGLSSTGIDSLVVHGHFGTSYSAPQVTGVIALIQSYIRDNGPFGDYPVVEDYEGMLKASADKLGYSGYDERVGWGHLQADSLFRMIEDDPQRNDANYKLIHITFKNEFVRGVKQVGSAEIVGRRIDSIRNKLNQCIDTTGDFWVEIYPLTDRYDLGDHPEIDFTQPVYVWGYAGEYGGWSLSKPNYQLSYTEIISGLGGFKQGNVTVPGIYHQHTKFVDAVTYQWDVRRRSNNMPYGYCPPTDSIMYNFTVFARVDSSLVGVEEEPATPGDFDLSVYPNPARNKVYIMAYNTEIGEHAVLKIYDKLGRIVLEQKLEQGGRISASFDCTHLPSGTYNISVWNGDNKLAKSKRLIITK